MSELNLIDLHTHSNFSPDAKSSLLDMCKRAEEIGLFAYAVTDHCDVNFWDKADDKNIIDFDMYGSGEYALKSVEEVTKLKDQFPNLICGIELGQPLQNLDKSELITNDSRLDFYYGKYEHMNICLIEHMLTRCYVEMLEMCKWGNFDVLGHLTYPLRYITGECGIQVDMSKFDDIIGEIFKVLIQNGKGIEINTSGLRQKYGKTFPDFRYVKMYKELGGEILTVGSDAHCIKDLGKGINIGFEIAKQSEFKYVTYYKNRKPEFLKID